MSSRDRPAWEGSDRAARLPPDWATVIRPAVLERDDYKCKIVYADICVGVASCVDHKVPGDDHRMENLQAACEPCHQRKSSQEGAAARPRLYGDPEPHPALS